MLEIKDLKIENHEQTILDQVSFIVHDHDKLAIIGEEGDGKSTLLKAIMGLCTYATVTGMINTHGKRLGYLKQTMSEHDFKLSVFHYLFCDMDDYYQKMDLFYRICQQLDWDLDIFSSLQVRDLSGGEKVKLQLCRILLTEPDILLLDEPTNDLDLETLSWLEQFINNDARPILFVSHDELFLEHTANCILHLERIHKKEIPKATFTRCDYLTYVTSRMHMLEKTTQVAHAERRKQKKQEEKLQQIMNKVEYQQETISRSNPHGGRLLKKKMKNLKAQERKLENRNMTEVPDVEEAISFFFPEVNIPKEKVILKLSLEELKVENHVLSHSLELEVRGPKHVVITGKNGVGKTTLLKYIAQVLKDRTDIKVGYMPQNYDEVLSGFDTPISFLLEHHPQIPVYIVRKWMGNMNLKREEMVGDMTKLSGGSKAKLCLLKLMVDDCDVLLLDEPTRNVSPLSNPVIRKALKQYQGCIISVSHDRKYIEEVADTVYLLEQDGIHEVSKR